MGSSYDDLVNSQEDVQDEIGYALDRAQFGDKADYAKPLKGDLSDAIEIVVNSDKRTFRGVYTTKLKGAVYVLDVFVKKSKTGIETPKRDQERIRGRYKLAREHYEKTHRKTR